jgi:hypothetical protein
MERVKATPYLYIYFSEYSGGEKSHVRQTGNGSTEQ